MVYKILFQTAPATIEKLIYLIFKILKSNHNFYYQSG